MRTHSSSAAPFRAAVRPRGWEHCYTAREVPLHPAPLSPVDAYLLLLALCGIVGHGGVGRGLGTEEPARSGRPRTPPQDSGDRAASVTPSPKRRRPPARTAAGGLGTVPSLVRILRSPHAAALSRFAQTRRTRKTMEFASPYVYAEDTAETGSGVAADAGAALTPPLTDATEGVSVTDLQQDFVSFASPALCDGGDGAAASAPPAPPRRGGGRGFAGGAGDNVGAGRGGGGRGWNVFERTAGYVFKGRDQVVRGRGVASHVGTRQLLTTLPHRAAEPATGLQRAAPQAELAGPGRAAGDGGPCAVQFVRRCAEQLHGRRPAAAHRRARLHLPLLREPKHHGRPGRGDSR